MPEIDIFPWTMAELEKLLRAAIERGMENGKVDLKSAFAFANASDKAELAKDVSAIANTDAKPEDDYGFIIFGAERGRLLGGVEALKAENPEKTSAMISQVLREYLAPVPEVQLAAFTDENLGAWGALVISPSRSQPHVFVRDYNGKPRRGDWFVRINDVTELARPEDYARVLTSAVTRAVRPLEREMQDMEKRVRLLEEAPRFHAATFAPAAVASQPITVIGQSAAASIAASMRTADDHLEDMLVAEAQKVASALSSKDALPWSLNGLSNQQRADILTQLEDLARPFVEAVITLVRYDREERHSELVARAVDLLAQQSAPEQGVGYQEPAQHVRLYPLVLLLHALAAVSANTGRVRTLKRVLQLRLRPQFSHDDDGELLSAYFYLGSAYPIFLAAVGERNIVPISKRMREVVPPWIAPVISGSAPADAFYVGEFLIGLALMGDPKNGGADPIPTYAMYVSEARKPIQRFLSGKPAWLESFLGFSAADALRAFDQRAPRVAQRQGIPHGLYDGAAAAFGAAQ